MNRVAEVGEELLPLLHFLRVTVRRREVRRRVIADSVRDSLDEGGALLPQDELSGVLGRCIDRKDIIAVDTDGGHAVGDTAHCDTVTSVLIIDGRRDGVHVVSAVEQCLASQGGREVQRGMEVTFRGSALTKVRDGNTVLLVDTITVASA